MGIGNVEMVMKQNINIINLRSKLLKIKLNSSFNELIYNLQFTL